MPTGTEPIWKLALSVLSLGFGSGASAVDLPALLACREIAAFDTPASALLADLEAMPGLRCKRIELRGQTATECEVERPLAVFGLPVTEFAVTYRGERSERTRSVFRASAPRVAQAAGRALGVDARPNADGSFEIHLAAAPARHIHVSPREDGASVYVCQRAPRPDGPEDILSGVDGTRGGISGRVSFPDGSLPPMRVCAVPRDPRLRSRCVSTEAGRADYLITGLAPGEYDVVSFALAGNSNGLVGAHAQRLQDCAPNRRDCAGGVLIARTVRAGEVVTDVDPDQFYTELPRRFDIVRGGEPD